MGAVMAARDSSLPVKLSTAWQWQIDSREDAKSLSRQKGREQRAVGNVLDQAADAYIRMARLFALERTRQVLADIAKLLRERVCKPMYTTTATLASVALDSEIALWQVREWCRSPRKRTMGKMPKNAAPPHSPKAKGGKAK